MDSVSRTEKEARLGQRGCAIWLYGLSGAGKSTLAVALERKLAAEGRATVILDGDNLRAGLNRGLGFSHEDRAENLRRSAEVAKLFAQSGVIALCAFITPLRAHRRMIQDIIGSDDLLSVYLSASFEACQKRDPKGLYKKAAQGAVRQFTGRDSAFEPPSDGEASLVLDTENTSIENDLERLYTFVAPRVSAQSGRR